VGDHASYMDAKTFSAKAAKITIIALIVVLTFAGLSISARAQSLIAGDITGTVTDPSGAVIVGATVTAKSQATAAVLTVKTNAEGMYRFSLLKPGQYSVSVEQQGFNSEERTVTVSVGQATAADFVLPVKTRTQVVEVTASLPLITTGSSETTGFSQLQVAQLPNPGADITTIAFTAPGVVVSNGAGYGNFTVNGLPGTSNLFTVNGENDMDPYFNINNSGATNLTLGANEIQEATVTANPYGGQYGQLAGAQVTEITKSGTNQFHGNAVYYWNGRYLNANDWMNNNAGICPGGVPCAPRPFSNANQWAASIGGPVLKDKTFFFVDTEGLRFVLPNVQSVTIPDPAFASAVLANVQANQPNEYNTYKTLLGFWANAPGANRAAPAPNSPACDGLTLNGFDPTKQSCADRFAAAPTALASEWILSGRVDQRIGNRDNLFVRYRSDQGTQPTYLDPISSKFDAISVQPSWDVQAQETHLLGTYMTNAFTAAASHYTAQFQQSQPLASTTFPYAIITSGSVPFSGFNPMNDFPQGRNITQYQFIDDFNWTRGKHTFKFGENFRRYDVSDHNFFFNYPGVYFGYVAGGLQEFADGLAYQYRRADNIASNVPIAMWGIGTYAQDEWNVKSNLKLTLALRAEHNSNPVCQINCLANFVSPWASLPSFTAGSNSGNIPYNKDIATGLHTAYSGVDAINWGPRIGFSWSPRASNTFVISGGFGIFYDNPAAGMVDDLLADPPLAVSLRVRPVGGTPGFDTTSSGSAAIWSASAQAFNKGFSSGETYSQIHASLAALGVPFAAPAFESITGTVHSPRWEEWNLQVQKQIGKSMAFVANYVGNHGGNIPYLNPWLNACDPGQAYGLTNGFYNGLVTQCPDYPTVQTPTVANYSTITQVQSGAISNYNGLTATFKRTFAQGVSFDVNYTYSHALDEVSNGGLFAYTFAADNIPLNQMNPFGLRLGNYGNADYDVRHLINADYVVNPTFHFENTFVREVLNGWQWAGKMYWHTGVPFSVVDGNWNGVISNGGSTVLGQPISGVAVETACGGGNASFYGTAPSCLNAAAFVNSLSPTFNGYTAFSNQGRNQYRGPHYFDMDMGLFKTFTVHERFTLGIGAEAYNVFNHPNFDNPDSNLADATFGQISTMLSVPTSPYGNFLGFDSSPRVVQLSAKLKF
jgi:hypothetical protein